MGQNVDRMGGLPGAADRPQRSDAARNRKRLLEAAAAEFAERGLDAGVGDIAARAGVGRGTLFRNFPTKQDLIAAIVVDRMHEAIGDGRAMLDGGDDAGMAFAFIEEIVHAQQENRALVEAVSEEFLSNVDIHAVHEEFLGVLDQMLGRGKAAGSIRPEVGALDVIMLIKGLCSAASALEAGPEVLDRHVDLIRAAISAPGYAVTLRGRTPTLDDLQHAPAARPARRRPPAAAA
jgi:AcrR family transcriptional regulator